MKKFSSNLLWVLISNVLFWGGIYGGYRMTNKEWIKKLNDCVQENPGMTMEDFYIKCREEND